MWKLINLIVDVLLFLVASPFHILKGLIWMLYFQVIIFLIVFVFALFGGM